MRRAYRWAAGLTLFAAAGPAVLPPRCDRPAAGPDTLAARGRPGGKAAVVRAALRGELSLPEAAARLRALDAGPPDPHARLRLLYPRATDDELAAWRVIQVAQAEARWGREPGARTPPAGCGPPEAGLVKRWDPAPGLAALKAEYRRRFPGGPPIDPPARAADAPAPPPPSPMPPAALLA